MKGKHLEIAIFTEQLSILKYHLSINESEFNKGESIFLSSDIQALKTIDFPQKMSAELLSTLVRDTLYNHGFVRRKSGVDEPSKKLRIYFTNAFLNLMMRGFTTVNSYDDFDYARDIQSVNDLETQI